MKTKLLFLFSLIGMSLMAQENTTDAVERAKQEYIQQTTRLAQVENALKTEQKLLEENKGYPDLSEKCLEKIRLYTLDRDALLSAIKKNEVIVTEALQTEKTKLESDSTTTQKSKKEKKSAKQLLKDAKAKINDFKALVDSKNANQVLSKNTNGEVARYMMMNGFNFELNSVDKLKYVGHFNIYVPVRENNEWGINTGLLKVNYKNNNDANSYIRTDLVKVNPLDNIAIGSSYYAQYNKYTINTDITSFSAYFQVLYKLLKKNNTTISAHFHSELLSTNYRTTSTITNIQQDEVKIENQDDLDQYNLLAEKPVDYIEKEKIRNDNFLTGYFGLGATLDLGLLDNCTLFFQATTGVAVQHNNGNRTLGVTRSGNELIADTSMKPQTFYLIRSYFQYYTSKSSQLVVGTDIRGYLPSQAPFYSIYAGVNLGIENIVDLFKDKKQ